MQSFTIIIKIVNCLKKIRREEVREKEEYLSQLREERGGINIEIKQIEQQEEASKLRMERNIKSKQLQEKSKEWAILILDKTIIHKVTEKYGFALKFGFDLKMPILT